MSHTTVPTSTYFTIFCALVVLTAVTTGVAFIDLGVFSPIVALSIACLKGTLVVLFFMHMKYSSKMVKVVGGASLFWLGILLVLLLSDYAARGTAWF